MSVKIRVSYTEEKELQEITRLLAPLGMDWKRKTRKGDYMRAYSAKKKEGTIHEAEEWLPSQKKSCAAAGKLI